MFISLITAMVVADSGPQHAVVLLIDDLGYGDTHHMGAEYPTPTIDVSSVFWFFSSSSTSPTLTSMHTS